MIPDLKTKLLFSEICHGDFARAAQVEFEKMQSLFARTNQKVSLVMRITLYPVDDKKGYPKQFKEIDYDIIPATVRHKSDRYVVEVDEDNVIVGDGKTINDCLQEELRFDELDSVTNNIITLEKQMPKEATDD